jgi:periodic tryptophan protein 1
MDVDEGAPKKGVKKKNADDLSEYKLDDYDEEETEAGGLFSNIKGLTYYKDNEEDPYITLKEVSLSRTAR